MWVIPIFQKYLYLFNQLEMEILLAIPSSSITFSRFAYMFQFKLYTSWYFYPLEAVAHDNETQL